MDEYIKREDAIKHLRGACIAKYPLSFSYGIFASADEIVKMPTADVAPKSKVAREIFEEIERVLEDNEVYYCQSDKMREDFRKLKKKRTGEHL